MSEGDFNLVNESSEVNPKLVRPSTITNLMSTFGTWEVEDSAQKLVTFFAEAMNDTWCGFHLGDLQSFYTKKGWPADDVLYGLLGPYLHCDGMQWHEMTPPEPRVVQLGDGYYMVTEAFITRCAKNVGSTEPV